MGNMAELRRKIDQSGMTMTAVAEKIGVSRVTLYNKLSGESEFKASEIVRLTRVLRLEKTEQDDIFLPENVF